MHEMKSIHSLALHGLVNFHRAGESRAHAPRFDHHSRRAHK